MNFIRKTILKFLEIYQKFFTLLGYGSCRYYPTCSEYAKQEFQNDSLLRALFFTIKRVLTCNQLFDGGIDYPIVKKDFKKNYICTSKIENIKKVKYWYVPKAKNEFFLIKTFKNKDK